MFDELGVHESATSCPVLCDVTPTPDMLIGAIEVIELLVIVTVPAVEPAAVGTKLTYTFAD